jgi:hypothetical protein
MLGKPHELFQIPPYEYGFTNPQEGIWSYTRPNMINPQKGI